MRRICTSVLFSAVSLANELVHLERACCQITQAIHRLYRGAVGNQVSAGRLATWPPFLGLRLILFTEYVVNFNKLDFDSW